MSIAAKCTCGYSVSGICTGSTTPQCRNLLKPMSHKQLLSDLTERIKKEAEHYTKDEGYQKAYIAGATAMAERAQVLVDALEKILKQHDYYSVIELAANSIQQWKGQKEVGHG